LWSHREDGALAGVDAGDVVPLGAVDDEVAVLPVPQLDVERHADQRFGVADVAWCDRVGVEELHAVAVLVVQVGSGEELPNGGRVSDDLEAVDVGLGGGTGHSCPFSKIGNLPCDQSIL